MKKAQEIKEVEGFKVVRVYRNLEEVQPKDFVKCINVHSASSYTKDKEYEVTRIQDNSFEIVNDNGKKKWTRKSNQHFELI